MWSALRSRALYSFNHQWISLGSSSSVSSTFSRPCAFSALGSSDGNTKELLSLSEVQKILNDVGADDVKVIPAPSRCEFTDYMVIATGRSPWHVRNISQALIYQVKQKQRGAKRMLLPTVVGQEGGKWIVIDSGTLIVHAVDEKARAYYNFEGLWTTNTTNVERTEDLEEIFVKVRRKNNSKKRPSTDA
ncbi:protein Iojap-related, mitochondrial [Andrographis paniculata]|uniref:protein Iojap-related, mitochondrial n=1 Tax=Andrographis paniculata TaxID=175694 RepID=UPI0021E86373|nr:protein Iojap-related, mitochondrial [Andrographis paniculata]